MSVESVRVSKCESGECGRGECECGECECERLWGECEEV